MTRKEKQKFWRSNYRRKRRLEIRSLLNTIKDRPCADCQGKFDPCVMDFDHIDPNTKVQNINALTKYADLERLLEEIHKCEVVCANCHRMRTKMQMDSGLLQGKLFRNLYPPKEDENHE